MRGMRGPASASMSGPYPRSGPGAERGRGVRTVISLGILFYFYYSISIRNQYSKNDIFYYRSKEITEKV